MRCDVESLGVKIQPSVMIRSFAIPSQHLICARYSGMFFKGTSMLEKMSGHRDASRTGFSGQVGSAFGVAYLVSPHAFI